MDPGRHPGQVRHLMLKVEIDPNSGFCGGVIRAISTAERELASGGRLYSLGAIVHNEEELSRLGALGLTPVSSIGEVPEGEPVLIRAHGVAPSVYREAGARGLKVVDCTCPVVLKLQRDIRAAYEKLGGAGQIIIFGKIGHPEVLGLVGQTDGMAKVVENLDQLKALVDSGEVRTDVRIELFSQTTKSPAEYAQIHHWLSQRMKGPLEVHRTICSQVASRHKLLTEFALGHDVVVFVSGRTSSNGKVLRELCLKCNPRTYHIPSEAELDPSWFRPGDFVGVSGATSTPRWLLERVAGVIENLQ